jgi:hypothetical protein
LGAFKALSRFLGIERQRIWPCADDGGHDHIDGDVAPAHDKGDHAAFWDQRASTIEHPLLGIRIQELHIAVDPRAVVERHHQAETLLDQEAVGIHIRRMHNRARHVDTIAHKRLAQLV